MRRMTHGLFAVFLSILSVFVCSMLASLLDREFYENMGFSAAMLISAYTAAAAFVVLLVWGIPVHLLLRRMSKKSIFYYLGAGFLPGAVLVLLLKPFGHDPNAMLAIQSLHLGALGAIAAAVFWFAIRRKVE